jgi:hypothetical protein
MKDGFVVACRRSAVSGELFSPPLFSPSLPPLPPSLFLAPSLPLLLQPDVVNVFLSDFLFIELDKGT